MAGDTLKFLDYRKSKLEAGDYTFEVKQTYGDPNGAAIDLPAQTIKIKVQGDRIRINPDQVFAKYPPSGEKGNFNDTIPHISLKKPTLPWERSAYKFDNDSLYNKGINNEEIHEPWFYLMLITEEDISRGDALAPKKVRVTDLNNGAYVPKDFYQSLSNDIDFGTIGADEEVQVVDLKKSFFKALIADRKEDLQYLAHVRQRESDKGDLKRELSVIMGNRFPQSNPTKYPSGMVNYALLVSLEVYLSEETVYISESEPSGKDLDDLTEESYIRCIILTQWSFTSKMDKINFEERSKALDVDSLRLPKKYSDTLITGINTFIKAKGGTVPAQNYDVLLLKTLESNTLLKKQVTELKSVLVIKDAEDSYQLGFYRGGSYHQEPLDTSLSEVINKKLLQFSTTQTAYNTLLAKVNACIQSLEGKVASKTDYLTFLDVGEDVDNALIGEVTDLKSVLISKQDDGTYKIGFCKKNNENAIYDSLLLNPNTSEHKKLLDAIDSQNKNLTSGSVLTYRTTVHPFIKNLPKRDGGTPFDDKLAAGMSAILHQFRQGDRSLSWYRGPCVPSETTHNGTNQLSNYERGVEGTYVPTDADRFLHYHQDQGMFDISYAAAYELGRFLAMRNEAYVKVLYRYKKAKSRYVFLKEEDKDRSQDVIDKGITIENLPYSKLNGDDLTKDLTFIQNYLQELALLKEVPHWYIIPDPNLLPQRTIRTFQIDFKWIQSLWLGALSLGGRTQVSAELYEDLVEQLTDNIPHAGFLLRSDLVWAYPEMVVNAKMIFSNDSKSFDLGKLKETEKDGYTDHIDKLPSLTVLRQEELTPEILMVLTKQDLNYLSLALPPEALHYGSDVTENTDVSTDLFTTNKLYVAGKRFSVVWAKDATVASGMPQIDYNLEGGTTPDIHVEDLQLTINLGMEQNATKVGELKVALLAHPSIQSVTTDSEEEERLLDDSHLKTSVSYVIAGQKFMLTSAIGHTLNPSSPIVSYDLGATPTVSIANGILAIDLGSEFCASTLEQLKIALEADPKINSVDIGSISETITLIAADLSTDEYKPSSKELNIGGVLITLVLAAPTVLDNHISKVSYTLQSGAIPIIAIDGSDKLQLQLGKSETPTSLRALKSMLEKEDEIQAVSTSSPDTAKLLATRDAYTQSAKELRIAGKKFTLTMVAGEENAINNSPPTVTFSPSGSTPVLSLSSGVLTIKLGQKANPTSIGQLKAALVKDIEEITSVEITEDLNTQLLPEGYFKTEKEFAIAGRFFILQLTEGQESQLDDVNPDVSYDGTIKANLNVSIQDRKLILKLGTKNSPTDVGQLKAQFLEQAAIAAVTTIAADNEALILNAYAHNKLLVADKELILTYHTDLLDDHVPLVRDVLADGSKTKARVQDRTLIIDVGGKQHPTTLAQLKTAMKTIDGITEATTLTEADDTDPPIHPYKRFIYEKAIKYAGSTVGDPLDISDLVNNQGIIAVSELAANIKEYLEGTRTYTDFASAHLSRFMLEGEPKVEFSAGGTN